MTLDEHNRKMYDKLCEILLRELAIALKRGEVGKIGVTADIKSGRISRARRAIDVTEDNS